MTSVTDTAIHALKSQNLTGDFVIPGDKSISHRALMFGALAIGDTYIHGLLEGEDVLGTADFVRALGAKVTRLEDGRWHVAGVGLGGLQEPDHVLDMGNSGTGVRLAMGMVATHPITCFFTGDASLCARPMGRVSDPLAHFHTKFVTRSGKRLPLAVTGSTEAAPIDITTAKPSAQVKSALILAALNIGGVSVIREKVATRDHTERLLSHFGAAISSTTDADGQVVVRVTGQPILKGQEVHVPADPSSAAFPMVAALLAEKADITLRNICLNPHRTGLFTCLQEMGAHITFLKQRDLSGETIADIRVQNSKLTGIHVPADRAASMIDEYPVLAMAAACAEGETIMEGLAELRVKESDRFQLTLDGLRACGVDARAEGDTLIVKGSPCPRGGATIATHLDHRIAMSFLILSTATEKPVTIDDPAPIKTSFPNFMSLMQEMGISFGNGSAK